MNFNKIYLGDAYELIKQVPDNSIDLIYTDPPYDMKGGKLGKNPSELAIRIKKENLDTLKGITDGFDFKIFDEFLRIQKKVYCYIWCSKDQVYPILNYFMSIKNRKINYNILTWCKTNPTPMTNGTLLSDIEYCLLFKEEGTKRFNNGYELKSKWYLSGINKKDKDLYNHPTCKPEEFVKRMILHSTSENDVILDPFMGSGTTCAVAKKCGRKYIGFELEEKYYKVAKDRLDAIDGKIIFNQDKDAVSLFDFVNEKIKEKL